VTELGFSGVHHVTIPVTDLSASIAWYTTCLAAKHVTRFDHHDQVGAVFAVILQLPGHGPQVQLRTDPAVAGAVAGYTPVTFGVVDRAELDRWVVHLDAHDIAFGREDPTDRGHGERGIARWTHAALLHRPGRRHRVGRVRRMTTRGRLDLVDHS